MADIADVVIVNGVPINGVTVSVYKASRFGTAPVQGTALPGAPDATAVTGGTGPGAWQVTVPDIEDYWAGCSHNGAIGWQFYPMGQNTSPIATGVGAEQSFYAAGIGVTGKYLDIVQGQSGTPDLALNPAIKVSRYLSVQTTTAGYVADGSEQLGAIAGITVADAATQVQPVGLYGVAKNNSTTGTAGADAAGVYGIARHYGTGIAAGGFFNGRAESATARANGVQLNAFNGTQADQAVNASGMSNIVGAWISCNYDTGHAVVIGSAGIEFGGGTGWTQWDTGIHFTSQVNDKGTGPVKTASIQDDSSSATSLLIKGTHATAAIAIPAGSGSAVIGGTTPQTVGTLLDVQAPNATAGTLAAFGNTANAQSYGVRLRNSVGLGLWGVTSAAGIFLADATANDVVFLQATAGKALRLAGGAATPGSTLALFGVTSGVNYLSMTNAATTGLPLLTFTGSDANVSGTISAKGTGTLGFGNVILPVQAATVSAPTYIKGGVYFDTTLNKLRIGGATAWETVTSS